VPKSAAKATITWNAPAMTATRTSVCGFTLPPPERRSAGLRCRGPR
jgi:hypothetical protein